MGNAEFEIVKRYMRKAHRKHGYASAYYVSRDFYEASQRYLEEWDEKSYVPIKIDSVLTECSSMKFHGKPLLVDFNLKVDAFAIETIDGIVHVYLNDSLICEFPNQINLTPQ